MVESSSVEQRTRPAPTRTNGTMEFSFDAPRHALGNDPRMRQRTAWALLGLLFAVWGLILASLIYY